jgi:hypothetical protein
VAEQVVLVCDVCGEPASETITIRAGGQKLAQRPMRQAPRRTAHGSTSSKARPSEDDRRSIPHLLQTSLQPGRTEGQSLCLPIKASGRQGCHPGSQRGVTLRQGPLPRGATPMGIAFVLLERLVR